VLAGGRSTRMGQDKALLQVADRSLIDMALGKLRALPLAAAPRIAGGSLALQSHAQVIADLHPGCGPLSGIEAALAASSQLFNVFVPVDTPLLPAQFLVWLLRRARITGALATIPRINGEPQPLCAVYHRQLLAAIRAALLEGNWKVMPVVSGEGLGQSGGQSTDVFDVEFAASADPSLLDSSPLPPYRWFHNCNTPEDMVGVGNALVLSQ